MENMEDFPNHFNDTDVEIREVLDLRRRKSNVRVTNNALTH